MVNSTRQQRSSDGDVCLQIGFDFRRDSPGRPARAQEATRVDAAAALIVETLRRLCRAGHCAVPEVQVLAHAQQQTALERRYLQRGLRRAGRQRYIAREVIDGIPVIFPAELREAEITIARCARQIAEGPHIEGRGEARLEKFALLCSPNVFRTIDLVHRLLSRVQAAGYTPAVLAPGADAANWYRVKLARPVFDLGLWSRHDARVSRPSQEVDSGTPIVVVLDASRIGTETLAELLEAIPANAALVLVGDLNDVPFSGHGQPFRDLVACDLFQNLIVRADGSRVVTARATIAATRRSALCWRLRRGAGLRGTAEPQES